MRTGRGFPQTTGIALIGVVNSASVAARCTALYAMVECDGVVAKIPPIAGARQAVQRSAVR